MHGECSTVHQHEMWSLGMPCFWDVRFGQGQKVSLKLSQQLQQEGAQADSANFVGVLNACALL
jgi:hypothetical protein